MPEINYIKFTDEQIISLCEEILRSVDYDIYKDDLEEGCTILADIECSVRGFLSGVEVVWEEK